MDIAKPPPRGRNQTSPFRYRSPGDPRRRGAAIPRTETRFALGGRTFPQPSQVGVYASGVADDPGQAGARECSKLPASRSPLIGGGSRRVRQRFAPWRRISKEDHRSRATGEHRGLLRTLAQEGAHQATQVEPQLRVTTAGLLRGRLGKIPRALRSLPRAQAHDLSRKRPKLDTTVGSAKAEPEEAEVRGQVYK